MPPNLSYPFDANPYRDRNNPNVLSASDVAVTGSLSVDLGIGHTNFDVVATLTDAVTVGGAVELDLHVRVIKDLVNKGRITLQVVKSNGTIWALSAAAHTVSFIAFESSSVL